MRRARWSQAVRALVLGPPLLLGVAFASSSDDSAGLARRELDALESRTKAAPAALAPAASAVDRARHALARASELRALGDPRRAELAEDAALDWALAARDLLAAEELERKGDAQAAAAASASSKAHEARALLDEAIAKRAKLQAELDRLDEEAAARALDAGPPVAKPAAATKTPTPSKKPHPKGKP
jgi:hypothetical protein